MSQLNIKVKLFPADQLRPSPQQHRGLRDGREGFSRQGSPFYLCLVVFLWKYRLPDTLHHLSTDIQRARPDLFVRYFFHEILQCLLSSPTVQICNRKKFSSSTGHQAATEHPAATRASSTTVEVELMQHGSAQTKPAPGDQGRMLLGSGGVGRTEAMKVVHTLHSALGSSSLYFSFSVSP